MNYTKQQELPDFWEYEHPDRTLLKRDVPLSATTPENIMEKASGCGMCCMRQQTMFPGMTI